MTGREILAVTGVFDYFAAYVISQLVDDIIVTREEIAGLTAGKLAVNAPRSGQTRLTD